MDAKYEQRKKMIYDFMCDDMYVPMKIKELAIVLGVKKDQRPQLEQILNDLMMEGRIVCSKRGKFSKSEEKKIVGTFQAHPKGFGFVSVEGEKEDIFIPESETNGAMHMDTVEISVSPAVTGRPRGGKGLHVPPCEILLQIHDLPKIPVLILLLPQNGQAHDPLLYKHRTFRLHQSYLRFHSDLLNTSQLLTFFHLIKKMVL